MEYRQIYCSPQWEVLREDYEQQYRSQKLYDSSDSESCKQELLCSDSVICSKGVPQEIPRGRIDLAANETYYDYGNNGISKTTELNQKHQYR